MLVKYSRCDLEWELSRCKTGLSRRRPKLSEFVIFTVVVHS